MPDKEINIKKEIDKVKSYDNYVMLNKLNAIKKQLWRLLQHNELTREKYEELHKYVENKIYKILS